MDEVIAKMSEGWCPFVTKRPGPAWKVGYSFVGEMGPKRGEVDHSAEGWWPGIYSALDGPLPKSWHFTIGLGRSEQHYPIQAHCWHAGDVDDDGGVAANLDFVGKEHLGVAGQPLIPYQVDMTTRITEWCAKQEGRNRFRRFDGWDPDEPGLWLLAEHKEVSDVYTECPSDRMRRLWAEFLRRSKMVSQEEFNAFVEQTEAVNRLQNIYLVGHNEAINFLSKVVKNHEDRIVDLKKRMDQLHSGEV